MHVVFVTEDKYQNSVPHAFNAYINIQHKRKQNTDKEQPFCYSKRVYKGKYLPNVNLPKVSLANTSGKFFSSHCLHLAGSGMYSQY